MLVGIWASLMVALAWAGFLGIDIANGASKQTIVFDVIFIAVAVVALILFADTHRRLGD
jgi:hypothetical protein